MQPSPQTFTDNSQTLKQYDNHSYHNYSSSVITGYVREFQQTFMWQIPSAINDMCFNYYFLPSIARLQFAYKLFNIIQTEQYNGQQLFNIVKYSLSEYVSNNSHVKNDEFSELNELIQCKYITLVSYKMNFFLFSPNVNNTDREMFQNNPSYKYQISLNKINELNQYKQYIQNNIHVTQQNVIPEISETSPKHKVPFLTVFDLFGDNEIFCNDDIIESTEQYDSEEVDYNSSTD